MGSGCSRRRVLQGLLGAAPLPLVIGWDPRARSWVTEAAACDFARLPPLDGTLHLDPATRAAFAGDFGRLITRQPCAVLRPGSVADIAALVRFARRHGLKVSMNGQAGTPDLRESHSTSGQAQAPGGVVIDAGALATIHDLSNDSALVDAGVHWSQLFDAAASLGLTPPVLTDYLHLSIGGTLSVGGIGGSTSRAGAQVDTVLELEVVTGQGRRVICSPGQRPGLFHAVLAGVGQCGIIARARVRLVAAPTQTRVYNLFYEDLATYLQDQLLLLADGRFSYLEGQIVRTPADSGWRYQIEAATYFSPPQVPDDAALLAGLRDARAEAQIATVAYRDFAFRIDPVIGFIKSLGRWNTAHPWLSLFLPASQAAGFIGNLVAQLDPADLGVLVPGVMGPALLYPFATARTRQPLFRVPDEPAAFHLSLLRLPEADPAQVAGMLADNRALHDQAVALGGRRYVIGAVPDFTPADWQQHFGPRWDLLLRAKARFDPDNVLTPAQGLFGA